MPSEARKRELKEQYKAMRPEMGVFVFRCVPTGVLEKLPYDKDDETKTDYSEELTLLCRLWQEKLPDHEEVWRNRT